MIDLAVQILGVQKYADCWRLQKDLQQQRIADAIPDTLLICEHPPVITIGKSGGKTNILADRAELERRGIEVFEVERGGDVTYHGPGQIVAYPILNLNQHKRDVHWYMRQLEEVVLRTLQQFEIKGLRIAGKTGVWTQPTGNAIDFAAKFGRAQVVDASHPRKIASLGVRISRWCTMHGLALNVRDCREGFALINPCGFTNIEMSSIEQETGALLSVEQVQPVLVNYFSEVFGFTTQP